MKRMLTLFVVLGLVACGAGVANAVVIIGDAVNNGDMDATSVSSQVLATPTGWVATSDPIGSPPVMDGLSSEGWNNVLQAGGQGVFFKSFQGTAATPFDASLHQDNPGTPGMVYKLHGWVGAGPGYSGMDPLGPTKTELALEFLNAGSIVIGGSVLNLGPAELGSVNGNPFDYTEYWVMAVAPPTTATVRARFSMIDGYPLVGLGDAALVTDYYTLTCVPEPAALALVGLAVAGLVGIRRRSK